ncbi:MAG: hypothetical protein JSS89_12070 [Bacteroidetes bacterium]|nr:hypothetical protein [Bacteroidota bacterium]
MRLAIEGVPREPIGHWRALMDLQVADWKPNGQYTPEGNPMPLGTPAPAAAPGATAAAKPAVLNIREIIRSIDGWVWPLKNTPGTLRALPRGTVDFLRRTLAEFDRETLVGLALSLAGTEEQLEAVHSPDYTVSEVRTALTRFADAAFVIAWWRYLDMRWRKFSEWPDFETQLMTHWELRFVPDPTACVWQSVASSYKGVHVLHTDRHLWPQRVPVALHGSRKQRTQHPDGILVRDTVIAWSSANVTRGLGASIRRP